MGLSTHPLETSRLVDAEEEAELELDLTEEDVRCYSDLGDDLHTASDQAEEDYS